MAVASPAMTPSPARAHHLRRRALLGAAGLAGVVAVVSSSDRRPGPLPDGPPPHDPALRLGTLRSLPERAGAEARTGFGVAMVELSWAQAEPRRGEFDAGYLAGVASEVRTFRDVGRSVTLGLGTHFAPRWALDLPGARFVDQDGRRSTVLNAVFSAPVRSALEDYLRAVAGSIDLNAIDAVRLTSGGDAEVLYPDGGSYWAFDANALGGSDLPPSLLPNPLPGWLPGDPSPGAPALRSWITWYVDGLADVVSWQRAVLRGLGFRGTAEVLTPGSGVRPTELESLVSGGMPSSLAGRGALWLTFYEALPADADLRIHVTSVADGSGGDDRCEPGDAATGLSDPAADAWSAVRWQHRIALEHGRRMSGENPGFGLPTALDPHYLDEGPDGMVTRSIAQAASCGMETLYWAHDRQLWDGTVDRRRLLETWRTIAK